MLAPLPAVTVLLGFHASLLEASLFDRWASVEVERREHSVDVVVYLGDVADEHRLAKGYEIGCRIAGPVVCLGLRNHLSQQLDCFCDRHSFPQLVDGHVR